MLLLLATTIAAAGLRIAWTPAGFVAVTGMQAVQTVSNCDLSTISRCMSPDVSPGQKCICTRFRRGRCRSVSTTPDPSCPSAPVPSVAPPLPPAPTVSLENKNFDDTLVVLRASCASLGTSSGGETFECSKNTVVQPPTLCIDSDAGNIPGTFGQVIDKLPGDFGLNFRVDVVKDICLTRRLPGEDPQLEERTCQGGRRVSQMHKCQCIEGRCVAPIVALPPVAPPTPPSVPVVKEQVKCVFSGSVSEQKCYSEKGECKGVDACVVDVAGNNDEKVTWKSTCGGYAYTVIDGTSEHAEFKCAPPAPTPAVPVPSPDAAREAEGRVAAAQKILNERIAEVQRLQALVREAEQAVEQARKELEGVRGK